MVRSVFVRRVPLTGAALLGMLATAGCAARVTRKDFDAEMVKIREEMQASEIIFSFPMLTVENISNTKFECSSFFE